jgi:hypothetical protein
MAVFDAGYGPATIAITIVALSSPPVVGMRLAVKPHGRLVPVSSTPYGASTSGLSTSLSRRGLQDLTVGIPNLGVGFPLICFQRLSRPDMATRQCGWRHNRYTSGPFVPVLSY